MASKRIPSPVILYLTAADTLSRKRRKLERGG